MTEQTPAHGHPDVKPYRLGAGYYLRPGRPLPELIGAVYEIDHAGRYRIRGGMA